MDLAAALAQFAGAGIEASAAGPVTSFEDSLRPSLEADSPRSPTCPSDQVRPNASCFLARCADPAALHIKKSTPRPAPSLHLVTCGAPTQPSATCSPSPCMTLARS